MVVQAFCFPIPATKLKDYKLLIMFIVFSVFTDYTPKAVKLKSLLYLTNDQKNGIFMLYLKITKKHWCHENYF